MDTTTPTGEAATPSAGWIRRPLPLLRHRRDLIFVFGAALGGMAVIASDAEIEAAAW